MSRPRLADSTRDRIDELASDRVVVPVDELTFDRRIQVLLDELEERRPGRPSGESAGGGEQASGVDGGIPDGFDFGGSPMPQSPETRNDRSRRR